MTVLGWALARVGVVAVVAVVAVVVAGRTVDRPAEYREERAAEARKADRQEVLGEAKAAEPRQAAATSSSSWCSRRSSHHLKMP